MATKKNIKKTKSVASKKKNQLLLETPTSTYIKNRAPKKPTAQAGSKVLCVECDKPIPAARLKLVDTDTCVICMEQLEHIDRLGRGTGDRRGTKRHQMEFEVQGTDDVEEINLHIRRGG